MYFFSFINLVQVILKVILELRLLKIIEKNLIKFEKTCTITNTKPKYLVKKKKKSFTY